MSLKVNKISVKQEGGSMIPEQPGMQQQPQVDPQVAQLTQVITESVQGGQDPHDVVASLIQNEVDGQLIAQALMAAGMEEAAVVQLFEAVQQSMEPKESSPDQVTQNPQLLSRNADLQAQQQEQGQPQQQMMGAQKGVEIILDEPQVTQDLPLIGQTPPGMMLNPLQTMEFRDVNQNGIEDRKEGIYKNKDYIPKGGLKPGPVQMPMINTPSTGIPWPKTTIGKNELQQAYQEGGELTPEMKAYLEALEFNKIARQAIGTNNKELLASFTSRNKPNIPYSNNELARDFSELQKLRQAAGLGLTEEASILFPHVGQQIRGGINEILGTNFKEGGEFEPHFMYKGKRKIRAKDMATHLRLKERGYTHDAPKAQTGGEEDKGGTSLGDIALGAAGTVYNGINNMPRALNPFSKLDDFLQITGVPANLVRESIEGLSDKGDGSFDWGNILPDLAGTSILDDTPDQTPVSQTLDIEDWKAAMAVDMALDPTSYLGAGVVKNLIKKGGKTLLKRLPKFATNLLPTNNTGGTPSADGQYLNGVFIPDEDKVNKDALASNLKRPAEWYSGIDASLGIMPMQPPPTVNFLQDTLQTGARLIGKGKAVFSGDYSEQNEAWKESLPDYYNKKINLDGVYTDENKENVKDWAQSQYEDWKAETEANQAVSDKELEGVVKTPPATFEDYLNETKQEVTGKTPEEVAAMQDIYRSMSGARTKKYGGGNLDKAKYGKDDFFKRLFPKGFGTPGFNPDKDSVVEDEEEVETTADKFAKIQMPSMDITNPIDGSLNAIAENPAFKRFTGISDMLVDGAGYVNRYFDRKNFKEQFDNMEAMSIADLTYGTKMSDPMSEGYQDINSGIMQGEAEKTPGYYMNFAGSPNSDVAQKGLEILPKDFRESIVGQKLNNVSQPSKESILEYWNQAQNIDSISSGLSFFNDIEKQEIENLMQEAHIDKSEVRDFLYKQPFYKDTSSLGRLGIRTALSSKGLKQGGEVIDLSQDMIAQLIAAGADIEII